ncbi:MarR family transcriptional regulator [Sphingobium sp.]|uniref:MarR family winged helix-turn-helix transcriptional regulator n=1 Tax=Sphingobium sp. TaxID=1912891 RepID=UPI000DAFB82C|nr:MarR family transcriptional regulator [Sphingobium sp.]PZU64141.1 MAG: MarR family transcriptional regulator [Sphingobium sp.]
MTVKEARRPREVALPSGGLAPRAEFVPDLEYDRFCILLQRAARLWRREANNELKDFRLSDSLTTPVWTLSKFGAMRQKDLADLIGVEGNSLVRILDELEREGLAFRRDDPADRRAKLVDLTMAGRHVAIEIEQVLRGFISEILSEADRDDVHAAFRVLSSIIEKATGRATVELARG